MRVVATARETNTERAQRESSPLETADPTPRACGCNMRACGAGAGEEPRLEFSAPLLELGPVLPYSTGEEGAVLVRNPCPFPVEFYSLEYDTQYLEEEKILRPSQMMTGYDDKNVLLLPPRVPGEGLPPELLEYYKDQNALPPQEDQELPKEREGSVGRGAVGELVANPVSRALARHMGLDLSPEGQAARNRLGISIIVHGAPLSGKTATAVALAKHYGAACLSVDSVVLEAVSTGGSRAGLQARELCARAAQEHAQKRAEETEGKKTEGSQPTSTSQPADSVALGVPVAQVHRRLSVSGSLAEDQELMTCLLPDDLLVDILSERLQLSDCHRGVVIDGLETPYCRSLADALQSVLKALSNRPLIYMVNLSHSYQALKATERAHREAAEREQRESMEREKLRLKEMDEEEYDALPEEEKERVDLQHLEELRQRRRREQERMQREQEERRQQEEQERLREEEEQRKRSKKGKKEQPKEEASGKKSQLDRKQSSVSLRCESKLEPPLKDGAKPSTEGAREPEDAGRKGRSREGQAGSPLPSEDPEREQMTEADRQLLARFQQYEQSQDLLSHTLQYWDRAKARLFMAPPTEAPPPDPQDSAPERHAPSGKKGRKEREREREKEREKERVERERLKAELAPPSPASAPALLLGEALEGAETEAPPEGVPQILLPVSGRDHPSGAEILGSGKLPPGRASFDWSDCVCSDWFLKVLDGLGQGPKGPPVPPPVIYSVVPYPEQRAPPSSQEGSAHFTFLAPPVPEDPAEDRKEAELEPDVLSSASLAKVRQHASAYSVQFPLLVPVELDGHVESECAEVALLRFI
ncbi:hypothetical protein ANANG_G00110200 [Anguilla anguilla]|uniref:Hydin adenylate kinase-like domain-containing protein n=1 Tax=Anguilla anguilla TaxID=7936 RepID=A0A9D3RZE0_ANGAN|nr:hypothetical protein ANANG_G00110200 [Anguilla anguilla]